VRLQCHDSAFVAAFDPVAFLSAIPKIQPHFFDRDCQLIMNELQHEIAELKQFIVELKADRAATRDKEKREAWTRYVSLSIVIIAVIAAIAAQWGGKYSSRVLSCLNDATFLQTQASDRWAHYQAKSIKLKSYEIGRDGLSRSATARDEELARLIKDYSDQIAAYKAEQHGIENEARELEAKRNEARNDARVASEKGGKMGLAISFFSVGVALASICTVTKKKPLWFVAIGFAAFAIAEMIRAWLV
jgi:hypothetical protein